jgi:hypothetical protein
MNSALMGLSQLVTEHSLMWSFRLDASLARCAHYTLHTHLLFFLECLVFRWAPACSTTQISLGFEPHTTLLGSTHIFDLVTHNSSSSTIYSSPNPSNIQRQQGWLCIAFQPVQEGGETSQVNVIEQRTRRRGTSIRFENSGVWDDETENEGNDGAASEDSALRRSSLQLLRQLNECLRGLDMRVYASLAAAKSRGEESEVYLLRLPCVFDLPSDFNAQAVPHPRPHRPDPAPAMPWRDASSSNIVSGSDKSTSSFKSSPIDSDSNKSMRSLSSTNSQQSQLRRQSSGSRKKQNQETLSCAQDNTSQWSIRRASNTSSRSQSSLPFHRSSVAPECASYRLPPLEQRLSHFLGALLYPSKWLICGGGIEEMPWQNDDDQPS